VLLQFKNEGKGQLFNPPCAAKPFKGAESSFGGFLNAMNHGIVAFIEKAK
jgi:hypothetical protein